MGIRVTALHCKEVVCVRDGARLGYVSDVEVELPEGQVSALIVPGKCRFPWIFPPAEDYRIPWSAICRIGDDIILVDCRPADCRQNRPKPGWFHPRPER